MWALIVGYGAINVAPLYLIFKLPWVSLGREAMNEASFETAIGNQEFFQHRAKTIVTNDRIPIDRECEQSRDEQ